MIHESATFSCDYCGVRSKLLALLPGFSPWSGLGLGEHNVPLEPRHLPLLQELISRLPGWRLIHVEGLGIFIYCPKCPPTKPAAAVEREEQAPATSDA